MPQSAQASSLIAYEKKVLKMLVGIIRPEPGAAMNQACERLCKLGLVEPQPYRITKKGLKCIS
jgi:hypothetical protein